MNYSFSIRLHYAEISPSHEAKWKILLEARTEVVEQIDQRVVSMRGFSELSLLSRVKHFFGRTVHKETLRGSRQVISFVF